MESSNKFYKNYEECFPLAYFLGSDDKAPNSYYEVVEKEFNNKASNQIKHLIANDIIDRIKRDFKAEEVDLVIIMLQPYIKYGPNLLKSMVFLADGSKDDLRDYVFKSFSTYRPNEIQDEAVQVAGSPRHFFNIPFLETKKCTNDSMDFSYSCYGRIPVEHFLSIDEDPPNEFYEAFY